LTADEVLTRYRFSLSRAHSE